MKTYYTKDPLKYNEDDPNYISFTHEALAEYTHEVWANWMKHFIPKLVNGKIKTSDIERWTRQQATRFENLSEQEKDSDRKVVQKILDKLNN